MRGRHKVGDSSAFGLRMTSMLKILITTGIFPPNIGGPATQIEYLASDLVKAGFDIIVLTYGAPEKKARPFKLFAVSRLWPSPLRQIFFGVKTFYLARSADLIYTFDLYSPGYYSARAAKFWHKKFVVRFAGDSAWETAVNQNITQDNILTFQDKKYNQFIEKRKSQRAEILKSADAVVAVSNFMKDLAIKIGVAEEKIHVIYNAVDFLSASCRWRTPQKPTLVYAGRLTPWKGVEMLIRVVAKLKEKNPDIIFEILGEGSEMNSLKPLVKNLKLEENVKFHGRVSEEESHKIFSRSTIFVLNTNYEGLSHAILNAMQIGVPVITTPVGGNPEIIRNGENGLLVPYNNESKWTEAIESLLNDNVLQEKFSANGKNMQVKFKWSELIKKTSELLSTI